MEYLFPFEKIKKDSRVIIYGLGNVGEDYLNQISKTNYCNVIAVSDKNYLNLTVGKYKLVSPEELMNCEFDFLVIAINNNKLAERIKYELINKGINAEKIVIANDRRIEETIMVQAIQNEDRQKAFHLNKFSMSFFLGNGLGDIIIGKKFIVEIARKLCVSVKSVDLYMDGKNSSYGEAIYSDCEFVNAFYVGYKDYIRNKDRYTISYSVPFRMLKCDGDNLEKIKDDEKKIDILTKLNYKIKEYGLDYKNYQDNYIHFNRCRLNGYNAYSFFNYYDVVDINDSNVCIPLKDGVSNISELKNVKYVTLNYGWGSFYNGEKEIVHCKVWPIKYYNQLIKEIRINFQNIKIVQLGIDGTPKMDGVDYYLWNYDIEIIKYILKDAVMHIDCEGGLMHLATQVGTKCAVLFGPTMLEYFGYKQNINIKAGSCHECIFLNSDIRICARKLSMPECMKSITPDIVMKRIKSYIQLYKK